MVCEVDKKWTVEMETQEMPHKPVLVVTCEDIGMEIENILKKTYMKDETGDALALLIVMFYLSTLSLHNKIKFKRFKRK